MTILFIDDDPDDTDLFCEVVGYLNSNESFALGGEKIGCITVNDGCKAVELLPNMPKLPDLIFMDVNMPLMDGRACLKFLKTSEKYGHVPVVMFSTAFSQHDCDYFKSLGAINCEKKPTKVVDLVKILSKYIYKDL